MQVNRPTRPIQLGNAMKTSRFLPASIALAVLGPAAAHAQFSTAGTLYVDLRATNVTAGTSNWLNEASGFGAGMNFTNFGAPVLVSDVNNTAIPGVFFGGAAAYVGPRSVPDLDGPNEHTVEVWALNPVIGDDETLVAWAHRGNDGRNMSIGYGANLGFGAVGHWGGAYDVGWVTAGNVPVANQWHHFAYTVSTNDAGIGPGMFTNVQVYVDGVLRGQKGLPANLNTFPNEAVLIGAQRSGLDTVPNAIFYSGYINSVRVHGGRLTAA